MTKRRGVSFFRIFIFIVAIVLAFVVMWSFFVSRFGSVPGEAQKTAARFDLQQIQGSLDAFRADVGRYPSISEGLDALIKAPSEKIPDWKGPYYARDSILLDPWGHPYLYYDPDSYVQPGKPTKISDLISAGSDGIVGTPDDFKN